MNDYIKTLIETNKDAVENIAVLEQTIQAYPVIDDKTKANYGNLCVMLNGYRNVAKASECMLINEGVVKNANGDFYKKITDEELAEEEEHDQNQPAAGEQTGQCEGKDK